MNFLFRLFLFFFSVAALSAAAGIWFLAHRIHVDMPGTPQKPLKVVINIPEPLKAELDNKVTSVFLNMYSSHTAEVRGLIPGSSPISSLGKWPLMEQFPVTESFHAGEAYTFTVSKDQVAELLGGKGDATLEFEFILCLGTAAFPFNCSAAATAVSYIKIPKASVDSTEPIDLGKATVTGFFPKFDFFKGSPLCRNDSGEIAISGKVIPTKQFLESYPKDKKFLLIAVPFSYAMPWRLFLGSFYASEFNPAGQSSEFRFQRKESLGLYSRDFGLYVIACDPNFPLFSCASVKMPVGGMPPGGRSGDVFPLVAKGLHVAECGDVNLTYYLHNFSAHSESSKAAVLPPEIVEGAQYDVY
jgi:hypothetical protein